MYIYYYNFFIAPKPDKWSDISISCPVINEDCKVPQNEVNRSVCGNLSMITPILQKSCRQDKMFKNLQLDKISTSYSTSISPIKREAFKKLKKCEGENVYFIINYMFCIVFKK